MSVVPILSKMPSRIRPTISVVTIVRNGFDYIENTIKSVLSQNYDLIEYVVIDGASTDGTVDIIRAYQEKICKWISEKDEGIADAFNKGYALSSGEYVLFLNSDDFLASDDVVTKIVSEIIAENYPLLIYGDCDVLDRKSGRVLYRASVDITSKGLRRGQMLPQPSLFAHRSYFEKYGMFDISFKIAMDYEWLLRGGMRERLIHVPQLITGVRNGGVSTVNQRRVVEEIVRALKKNACFDSMLSEWELRSYFFARRNTKRILNFFGLHKVLELFRTN